MIKIKQYLIRFINSVFMKLANLIPLLDLNHKHLDYNNIANTGFF